MTEKISENRQLYKAVDSDDVVNKVKQVLIVQKYMVTETYVSILNINLN